MAAKISGLSKTEKTRGVHQIIDVLTRIARTLSAGQFRPLVHDFQISGVAENPVALARGKFPYDA